MELFENAEVRLCIYRQEFFMLLLGCAVSFGVSVFAIKFLMKYIKNHDFKVFGYYRIVLGVIVLLYFGVTALMA